MTICQYRTPGTRLWWRNVAEWCDCAYVLNRRRLSHKRNRDLEAHGICVPLEMIYRETDIAGINLALWFYTKGPTGLQRPQRGKRGDHGSTPIIMALKNRRRDLVLLPDTMPKGDNWRAIFEGPE